MNIRLLLLGALCIWAPAAGAQEQTASDLAQAIESTKVAASTGPGYDAVFRRDPMRPLVDGEGNLLTSVGFQDGLSVQGIIWSDERPLVVVDDELLAEGGTVGPYTIMDIQPDGVTVQQGDHTLFVPLDRGLPLPDITPQPEAVPQETPPQQ